MQRKVWASNWTKWHQKWAFHSSKEDQNLWLMPNWISLVIRVIYSKEVMGNIRFKIYMKPCKFGGP